jgi:predicted nucleotidyltransferase
MRDIFITLAGSRLYGTNTPESDIDHRGVAIPSMKYILGFNRIEQLTTSKPIDSVTYALAKFMQLAKDCNPNIIELLFAPTRGETCIMVEPEWDSVLEIRSAFVSKKAKHTFSGYAFAQAARMRTHHEYMTGHIPPDVKPEDFGAFRNEGGNWSWPSGLEQNAYSNAHNKFTNYQEWLRNRNPYRHALEQEFGYDTKHGMHLVRLITEGEELLSTGKITLPRPDAKFLLQVKNGFFSYDEIMQYAEDGDNRLQKIHDESDLPFSADVETIEKVLIALYSIQILYEM